MPRSRHREYSISSIGGGRFRRDPCAPQGKFGACASSGINSCFFHITRVEFSDSSALNIASIRSLHEKVRN
jgi:hypothetical protein